MKRITVHPQYLIPTDCPRSLMGVLKFIPSLCAGKGVPPIIVVSASSRDERWPDYYVCSGNHRAAAAHICKLEIEADAIEWPADIAVISEGEIAKCTSIGQLIVSCHEAAESGQYLTGRWVEYLRMITDSGAIGFEESDSVALAEQGLRRARPWLT